MESERIMGPPHIRVAVLCGSDSQSQIAWDHTATIGTWNCDSWRLLDLAGVPWRRVQFGPRYFQQPRRWDLARFDVAMSIVTDPDRDPVTLAVTERALAGHRLPLINPPVIVRGITRDGVAARLTGIDGLVVPRTIRLTAPTRDQLRRRLTERPFRFPGLLRIAGTQIGETLRRVERIEEVEAICDGRPRTYILTEFVDFRSPDGLYRKTRFFFVGERIIIRHRIVSTSWNIHSGSRDGVMVGNAALAEEEDAFIAAGPAGLSPPLQRALRAVRGRIGLHYFGMDCALLPSGELLLFEANPTMNVLNADAALPTSPTQREACLAIAHALAELVRASPMATGAGG